MWNHDGAVTAIRRSAAGSYEPQQVLGRTSPFVDGVYDMGVGAAGDVVVAWDRIDASTSDRAAIVSVRDRDAQTFSDAVDLARGTGDVAVDVDDRGNSIVVWSITPGNAVRAVVRAARGAYGAVEDVSEGPVTSEPDIAVGADGSAVAVWRVRRGGANRYILSGIVGFARRPCVVPRACASR